MPPKRALVMSGGGSKGSFSVGAVEYLVKQAGLDFDIIVGTSTGALITPLVAAGDIDELVDVYSNTTTDQIVLGHDLGDAILHHNSLYDSRPLGRLIKEKINAARFQTIKDSGKSIVITTVLLQTGKTVYFHYGPIVPPTNPNEDFRVIDTLATLRLSVWASANMPVFTQPVKIPTGSDKQQYSDGGVREYAPLKVAIDMGADEIYLVILSPKQYDTVDKEYKSLLDILTRTIGLFGREVALNDVNYSIRQNELAAYIAQIRERVLTEFAPADNVAEQLFSPMVNGVEIGLPKQIKLKVIRPDSEADLPPDSLTFVPAEMRQAIVRGREIAEAVLNQ